MPSNPYSSQIALRIAYYLSGYLVEHDIAHVTDEAGGYRVVGERYAPAVAVITKARQPELAREGYNPNAPDLAVEIVSPTDSAQNLRIKLGNYLAAGVRVWVVYPGAQEVEDYTPGQPVRVVGLDGVLAGGDLLPGFTLAVKDIFPA